MSKIAIIGAGPAGLTAAWELSRHDQQVTVLEADPIYVGGISRTVQYKGFCFDIGGHRFFSKSREVEALWSEMLPDGMLDRPRSSRIYYGGRFFSYPLRPFEALATLGPVEAAACVASYARARVYPVPNPDNFEDWVVNQFGERLYRIFFKTYTEKVWGMSCREISADWAAQRIKGLSLSSAVLNAFRLAPKERSGVVKTLIDSFRYPRRGPGMLWEASAATLRERGVEIRLGRRVTGLERMEDGRYRLEHRGASGDVEHVEAEHVVSSAPIAEILPGLTPTPSAEALAAAAGLGYRDFLIVVLIGKDPGTMRDNWIYIQDPGVKVGRVQNFKSWSPDMVPNPDQVALGCEYFCNEGDELWRMEDARLVELASSELDRIGLFPRAAVADACVVRQRKAYPVYDARYAERVERVRAELAARYPNLHLVGRNGMHKYNNQDHSMMTALLTARNIVAGEARFDVWRVNQDAEYHEAGEAGAEAGLSERATGEKAGEHER